MRRPRLRHNVRALILERTEDRTLLLRFDLRDQGLVLWATPGGGVEDGEEAADALRRELREEVGLRLSARQVSTHIWSERVLAEGHAEGYDGVVNDFYLVTVSERFEPRGSLTDAELRDENILEHRWWSSSELLAASADTVFGPRQLPRLFAELLESVPTKPIVL